MDLRRVLLVSYLVLVLVVVYSVVVVASSPSASAAAPAAPAGAPAAESALITATGTALIPSRSGDLLVAPQTLMVSVWSKAAAADLEGAVAEMQQRLLAIRAAIEKTGVPADAIRLSGLNVSSQSGMPPEKMPPAEKGQPQAMSFSIVGSLQVDVPDLKLLVAASNAATANGATQVSLGGKGQPSPSLRPPDAALAEGMADAIANARQVAQAMASASGKRLGEIHSISANQLYPMCCPPQGGWNLQVTVSFAIAP